MESDRKLRELLHVSESKHIDPDESSCSVPSAWDCPRCAVKFDWKIMWQQHKIHCEAQPATAQSDSNRNLRAYDRQTGDSVIQMAFPEIGASECFKCRSVFESLSELRIHNKRCRSHQSQQAKKSAAQNNPLTTVKCQQTLQNKHVSNVRKNGGRSRKNYIILASDEYSCNLCTDIFVTRRAVCEHIRKHHGQKALCNICGKLLSDRNNLNKHYQSVHLKQKRYSCTMCDNRYDSSYRLRIHINSHQGIRNYACTLCPSKFISCAALTRHIKTIHTEEKKYVCAICAKGFKLANKLKMHMFVHTGQYEHPCEHCGKGFRQKSKLVHHVQEVHAAK